MKELSNNFLISCASNKFTDFIPNGQISNQNNKSETDREYFLRIAKYMEMAFQIRNYTVRTSILEVHWTKQVFGQINIGIYVLPSYEIVVLIKQLSSGMKYQVIFTADDLGIDIPINDGIIETYRKGILKSSALLMNVPHTDQGIKYAKENPGLEIGLHLSIVEGISLRGKDSSITDPKRYFDNKVCLLRDWKSFIKKYLTRNLNYTELREELELQIIEFLKHFQHIPFLNGTQHMHILPGVWRIVFELCRKYNVKAVRLPKIQGPSIFWINKRFPFLLPFQLFGQFARRDLKNTGIKYPDDVLGMQYSGKISEDRLLFILKNLPVGKVEIVMHPGFNSKYLRENLPWGYSTFDWETEKSALLSPKVKDYLDEKEISIINFSQL
jgi:predicted glycoside hydrolase/deacetylase ChbG (UPF0249 family)